MSSGERIPLSVLIPVYNEEENLPAALASVAWASEVVVVDSQSNDRTATLAREAGAIVVDFEYPGKGPKKKAWAFDTFPFDNDWILWIDADERVTSDLRAEIEQVVADGDADGYCVDREFVFMGRALRCFRPNWIPRLFRRGRAQFEDLGLHELSGTGPNEMHENLIVDGRLGFLQSPLLHDDYRGITPWIDRHNTYATWEARARARLRAQPLDLTPRRLIELNPFERRRALRRLWARLPAAILPPLRFVTWFVFRRGFLDGRQGLVFCLLMAWYELLVLIKGHELQRS